MISSRLPKLTRAGFLSCVILAFGSALLARAAYIQLGSDERLAALEKRQFHAKVLVRPRRGVITDRSGEPLAINVEINSLAASPAKVGAQRKTLSRLLAKALQLPEDRVRARLSGKKEFAWIKRHLSEDDLGNLRRWRIMGGEGDLAAGLWLVKEAKRVYPHHELAAHVLGSVNLDTEGQEGIELLQNDKLQGKVASVAAIKDALGRPSFLDADAVKAMRNGAPVALTLDASLQFAVEHELRAALEKTSARAGGVLVMNAVTGEILAMANAPVFDPNLSARGEGSLDLRRNRLVTDGYEPGSTLKAVLLASALSHGGKLTDRVYAEQGSFVVQGKRIKEAEAHEKFEMITYKEMLKYSSNVGAAKIALKLGADKYLATLDSLGIGKRTQITFPGEISGRMPARAQWKPLTLANIGFGHGVLVTPIQMARAYAALVNGGWLVQPKLLMEDPADAKRLDSETKPPQVLSAKVAQDVLVALESVTSEKGTGIKAALPGYRVAGKTGTAQVVDPKTGTYSRSRYITSFIGTALDVSPKLVILAVLDEPKNSIYASETAAPLFREVLNATVTRFGIPPTQEVARPIVAQAASQPFPVAPVAPLPAVVPVASRELSHEMPQMSGMSAREAIRLLQGNDIELEVHGTGWVRSQWPEPGTALRPGTTVKLTLSAN